ncbi:hypothetical protein QJS66_07070 [Kocuria rhizophila]|nr:hypothetical protein QJS66_07070 [Kocuria rhizophila]
MLIFAALQLVALAWAAPRPQTKDRTRRSSRSTSAPRNNGALLPHHPIM